MLACFEQFRVGKEQGLSTGGGSGVNRVAFLGELELRRLPLVHACTAESYDRNAQHHVAATLPCHATGALLCGPSGRTSEATLKTFRPSSNKAYLLIAPHSHTFLTGDGQSYGQLRAAFCRKASLQ